MIEVQNNKSRPALEELGLPYTVIAAEPFDEEARRNIFGQAAKALRA